MNSHIILNNFIGNPAQTREVRSRRQQRNKRQGVLERYVLCSSGVGEDLVLRISLVLNLHTQALPC
jgi:hypothetical protein